MHGKELAMKFATERLMVNGKKKFHESLPKTTFATFRMTAKSKKVEKKNNNLSASSEMMINYKKSVEHPLSPVPLSISTAKGGRRTTSKCKLLNMINATLIVPPNIPKLVISIDTTKPSTLIIDLIAAISAMMKISETYKKLAWKFSTALPKGYYRVDQVADLYRDILIKSCERPDRDTST